MNATKTLDYNFSNVMNATAVENMIAKDNGEKAEMKIFGVLHVGYLSGSEFHYSKNRSNYKVSVR